MATDETGIAFTGSGTYRGHRFEARGHAGEVLSVRDETTPFPIRARAKIGSTTAKVDGSITGLAGLKRIDTRVELSRFLMELVALDLWGVARVKLKGDEPIEIRCAIADFAVKDGLMQANAFVFDTAVVNVEGGVVNLKNEEMDLELDPKPKGSSLASLNSPLYVRGTFGDPKVSPDVGKPAAKGVGAIVIGVINPLLAVLPLLKEGRREDSNCVQLIAQAGQSAASGATKPRPRSRSAR